MKKNYKHWKGLFYGIVYGLVARAIFALEDSGSGNPIFNTSGLMTVSFMFIVPFVVGLITAYHQDTITSSGKIAMLTMPVFAIIGLIGISVLAGKEGIICALMALPVFLCMVLIGGLIGINVFERNRNKLYISAFILLPFLLAPLESRLGSPDELFSEHTNVVINANNEHVWNHITRVREITEDENNLSLFQLMGFPRPVEAELDTIAIGGIRKAIFERGLFFTETVTQVEPLSTLAFDIKADPNSIPPTALDEHVLVGGKYFDVLEGKYEIERINENKVILHLTSQFKLSTRFNFYSGFWSKLIMKDIQENILDIIKRRSESDQHSLR
jgi:hypothetical protein